MEKMPYQSALDVARIEPLPDVVRGAWPQGLPTLEGRQVVLRDLRESDATSLFALLSTEEVSRFISPPPSSVEDFERFIAWSHRQCAAGSYVCFAVTLKGYDTAIGIFQIRQVGPGFETAEWGFVIGSPFWGTGVFADGAELALEFAFDRLGVHRLEARAAVQNGRGNGALIKVGAVQEAVMRKSFFRNGRPFDQIMYSIVKEDWRAAKSSPRPSFARAFQIH